MNAFEFACLHPCWAFAYLALCIVGAGITLEGMATLLHGRRS